MALYTVSSSGNLNIADTGLKNPVSFFTPEGISTGAVADGPLAGNNSRVYIIDGQGNRYQSNGQLKLFPGDFITGINGISATALGEIPLAGGDNTYLGTGVTLAHITSVNQSSGNLVLTGTDNAIIAYRRSTSGNLVLTGSVSQLSKHLIKSSGQLRLTGSVVTRSIRQFSSSGNLKLYPVVNNPYNIHLRESTTDQLKLTGYTGVGLKRDSSGQIVVNGSFTNNIFLKPTSSGSLTVATQWYTVNRIGGLSTEALASSPIAAGTDSIRDILNTTRIAFYGITGLSSTGNLILSPFGTPPSDLSQDGSLAGSALGSNSITEHRFNTNSTQYRQLQNITSAGQLKFDLSVKYRVDSESGQLVVTGAMGSNNDRRSSGSLKLTGSNVHRSILVELTSGQLKIRSTGENPLGLDSGLGGSPLASLPLGGGIDLISGVAKFNSTRRVLSTGQLKLSGVAGIGLKRLSSGQLVLTGSVVTSSLRKESTSGQLKLSSSVSTRSIRRVISNGSLIISQGDGFRDRWTEGSSGQLRLTGSVITSSTRRELTSGQLKLTGSEVTRSIRIELTNGQLQITSTGENPLGLDSSLGSSSLASLPLGGGLDLITGKTTFKSFRNELSNSTSILTGSVVTRSRRLILSNGQLRLTGSSLPSSTRRENTSGQLRLTGSDYNTSRRVELSNGQLRLTGSVVTRSLRIVRSSGSLVMAEADAYRIRWDEGSAGQLRLSGSFVTRSRRNEITSGQLTVRSSGENPLSLDSGLGSSALASVPLGGGIDLIVGNAKFSSTRLEISNSQLKLTSTLATSSTRKEQTAGNTVLTGSTAWRRRPVFNTSGNLITNGAFTFNIHRSEQTTGQLRFSNTGLTDAVDQSGVLGGSPLAYSPLAGNIERVLFQTKVTYVLNGKLYNDTGFSGTSSGNLVLTGSTVSRKLLKELSSGQLQLTGAHTKNIKRAETSSGQLRLTGRTYQGNANTVSSSGRLVLTGAYSNLIVRTESTTGRLVVTGTHNKRVAHAETTSGRLVLTGAHNKNVRHSETSNGQLRLSGYEYQGTRHSETSSGRLVVTGSHSKNVVHVAASSGQLRLTAYEYQRTRHNETSLGRLVLTGAYSNLIVRAESTTGRLVLSGVSDKQLTFSRRSTTGRLVLTGSYSYSFNNSSFYEETSRGQLRLTGSHSENVVYAEPSSGQLRLTGTLTNNIKRDKTTTGNLLLTGSEHFSIRRSKSSTGNLKLTGSEHFSIRRTKSSTGNLKLTGSEHFNIHKARSSTGLLKLVGNSVVLHIAAGSIVSHGNLVLTGLSVSTFIAAPKKTEGPRGGSYVFNSSWDILKPYFPDDRHILGYIEAETSGLGTVELFGTSTTEFIPAPANIEVPVVAPPRENILSKYIKSVEEARENPLIKAIKPKKKKAPPQPIIVPEVSKFKQQALREDELLLNGSLLDFEDPDDELDRELSLY